MTLNETQNLFKKSLVSMQVDPKMLAELKPAGKLSLEQAFEIYHQGYIKRLTDTLKKTYEGVWWVLGEALFSKMARRFIESQPSVSYDLSEYGEAFPDFLRTLSATKVIPFIYDLARFEWTFKSLINTPTPDPLSTEQAEELIRSDDFKVHFIEAMEIFESPYAIYDIWTRRKEPAYEFEGINWDRPESLMIYKKNNRIYVQRMDKIEAQVINAMKDGASIGSALAEHTTSLAPEQISQFYQMMIGAGIIEDVTTLENHSGL
ncbi:DNA-binding domain-containing protein [Bdellovibrio sp. 22V]|uniref:HvfC/BufC N-terminal domain-containing protein n=1 Tax=Bdellovibrio TaxID=958 RepID=UPI0025426BCE|nr:DNA-binding domain-containing protein [Bdellovibrio sp. 22V]WII72927.1 DNA-binding domain-containing protein [Bdellovibrio sp. 22V]